jgi:hypothetical protein
VTTAALEKVESKAYSLIGTVTGNADRSRVPRARNFRSGSRIGYGVDRTTDRGWNDVPKKLDREEEQRIVLEGETYEFSLASGRQQPAMRHRPGARRWSGAE